MLTKILGHSDNMVHLTKSGIHADWDAQVLCCAADLGVCQCYLAGSSTEISGAVGSRVQRARAREVECLQCIILGASST